MKPLIAFVVGMAVSFVPVAVSQQTPTIVDFFKMHGGKSKTAKAPLPGAVTKAKSAFLTNGGGSNVAFDEFYQQFKAWGRFEIASSPAEADIIVDLRFLMEQLGTRSWGATDYSTGEIRIHSNRVTDPQLTLSIFDAKTKDLLWSTTDHRKSKIWTTNDTETVKSADRLISELKSRLLPIP